MEGTTRFGSDKLDLMKIAGPAAGPVVKITPVAHGRRRESSEDGHV